MRGDDFKPQPKPKRAPKARQRLGSSSKRELPKLIYRFVRAAYLAGLAAGQGRRGLKPLCERCGKNIASHVHHIAGKDGAKLIDPKNLAGLCEPCHPWLHANPAQAYTEGWMKKRNQKGEP
jgi:5-methylcytosine-specific restriction endonuclease McrA